MNNSGFEQRLTDFFKAFGNEKRQEIILRLFAQGGEHNIGQVAKAVGLAQSTASEHLAILKRGGILVSRKQEKEVFYKLSQDGIMAIMDQVSSMLNCCPEK